MQNQLENRKSLAKTAASNGIPPSEVLDQQSMIWGSDQTPLDVQIRRSEALLKNLKSMKNAPDLSDLEAFLKKLKQSNRGLAKTSANSDKEQYMALRKVTRQAALSNPLLDGVDDLLFVLRFNNNRGWHMISPNFGHNQIYRGALYVLKNFKTGNPELVDILENSVMENGRWKGQKLSGNGSFMSPELSFDGKKIVFCWAKKWDAKMNADKSWGPGWPRISNMEKGWNKEMSFHVFTVNIDGTNLRQLTDSPNNDFDPCWLPNGRIVFVSDRRGGFGRCHGSAFPNYTMYSMKADGSDLFCIDWHETNEWSPSVDNDGMLVYSRWDYVDRDDCIAHHFWICYPDGRDPRAPHGNYPKPYNTLEGSGFKDGRKNRPFAEFHIRSIPNSGKYIATAGPHHGDLFGSLVMIDVNIPDDDEMSQVKRITPDYGFPEAGVGPRKSHPYGTARPLSEDYYLCNYKNQIVLLDKFGNKEALWATDDKFLRPLDPIPVAARPLPPVIPTATWQGERYGAPDHQRATISVMNVNITDDFGTLPKGVKIKEMRIVQVFTQASQSKNKPRVGHGSESLVRMSLGTAPVEDDGSVYCEAPVGKEIYFQLLDENGVAVQGMRSGTYVHPGEQMSCVGCHENRWEAIPPTGTPLAMKRPPSKLKPEPGGLEPVNYARLVKPVFDKHCINCHKSKGKGPDMSFKSLGNYVFAYSGDWGSHYKAKGTGGSRTTPGRLGSRESKLYNGGFLSESHYDVALTKEESRRITLWLDLNSNELSAYTKLEEQKKGELVWPLWDATPDNPQGVEHDRPIPNSSGINTPAKSTSQRFEFNRGSDNMHVVFPEPGEYAVFLNDGSGKKVISQKMANSEGFYFSTKALKSGVYFISIKSSKFSEHRKLAVY